MLLPLLLALALPLDDQNASTLDVIWTTEIGPGFSSAVVSGERGYVTYREPASPEDTVLLAFDLASGATAWRRSFPDLAREGQEDYGGGSGPHATPLVHRGAVVVLGFGGAVHAFDERTGAPLWSVDLVEDLGAKPVQFGFAASPIAVGESVVIVTGAPAAGITAFDPRTGAITWRSPGLGASYVTPVVTTSAGRERLVGVSMDEVVVLDPRTGAELARTPHVRPGLTNYAMVLALGTDTDRGVLVSGQGTRGTRWLQLGEGAPEQAWSTRAVQFSHGRVLAQDGFVYGSNGNVLCALDITDGAVAFKVRAFGECSLVAAGDWVVALDEGGTVALLELRPERVAIFARRAVLREKSWAAPTVTGDRILVRDAERLVALQLPPRKALENPIEVIDTGYVAGVARVSPARVAFAQGRYRTIDGREFALVSEGANLALRLPGAAVATPLVSRSEVTFEAEGGQSVTLEYGSGPVPVAIVLRGGVRAERVAWEPIALDAAARARVAGTWVPTEGITVVVREREDRLEASLSHYPDVLFTIVTESPERLWLRARNAPYDIPEILAEVPADETLLVLHQGDETFTAIRRRPGAGPAG